MREAASPDFIEAIARGLSVIKAFDGSQPSLSLTEVAARCELSRPTTRRILITLGELGYVRSDKGQFSLTARVLELGAAYVASSNFWEIARPHLVDLVGVTQQSSSIAQLDGSDIIYISRVAVPKLVALTVSIGTRFPAVQTSLGKVLLAALPPEQLDDALGTPSRSGVTPTWQPTRQEIDEELSAVRARGWALTDQQLAPAIRSVAAPIRNGDGVVKAAVNVNAHALETSLETLVRDYLPALLQTAGAISADFSRWERRPTITLGDPA
ncbi:MAG: IclR family transcriptional regulator [Comamonadaceae bacterium]|nr:MAG: IclR family transcriptional regulator [Comamonadaceae bacterium]